MKERIGLHLRRFESASILDVADWAMNESAIDKENVYKEDQLLLRRVFPASLLYEQVSHEWPGCGQEQLEKSLNILVWACWDVVEFMHETGGDDLFVSGLDQTLGDMIFELASLKVLFDVLEEYIRPLKLIPVCV